MLQGRNPGTGLPQNFTQDGMAEANTLFGKGSNLSNTGTPTQFRWDGDGAMNRYARTALNGGVVSDNVQGKTYNPRTTAPKFDGRNRGVTDSRTLGICAMTYANGFIQKHSMYTHGSDETRDKYMRDELLANLSDNIRPLVAAFDEKGPWLGLLTHFLTVCGPTDIKPAISVMLEEALAEDPPRTLRQRVEAATFAWERAHDTFYKVKPEQTVMGEYLEPCHCSPYIPVHEQYGVLKDLVERTSTSLWLNYCQVVDERLKENPVCFHGYITKLNADAHNMIVQAPTGSNMINLRVEPGRRSETYTTTQHPDGYTIANGVPAAALKRLEQRAIGLDTLTESNRLAYENSWKRGVNPDARRFCIAFGHPDELIQHRHDNHLCYMCGDNVRANGGLMHTFWECPQKLECDDRIQKVLSEQTRHDDDNLPRKNTQYQANARRDARDGSARQDADQDTSYGRPTQRGNVTTGW